MLDLKPENILLTTNAEYPRVLFSDFGMACECGDKNIMGTMCGTFAYMYVPLPCLWAVRASLLSIAYVTVN